MENQNTYNGWTNHATWKVGLECFDGWSISDTFSADEWLEVMRSELEDIRKAHRSEIDSATRAAFFECYMIAYVADYMRDLPTSWVDDVKDKTLQGWLTSWLDQVNWRELAKHHLELDSMFCQMKESIKNGGSL